MRCFTSLVRSLTPAIRPAGMLTSAMVGRTAFPAMPAFVAITRNFSAVGERQTGVAKMWSAKGFGFIAPDDGGDDIFCHVGSITDGNALSAGSKVEFSVSYDDRRGKYRADEVTGGTSEEEQAAAFNDRFKGMEKVRGRAARWNEKGFGFIHPDDGSEDVFCHVSAIQDGDYLPEGAEVMYCLTHDERKGKARAENVTGGAYENDATWKKGSF